MRKTSPKTPRIGRPPKDPKDLHSEYLFIRLTLAQKVAIEKAAGGSRVAEFCRDILLGWIKAK
jgi:hypothetical protein